MHGTFRDIRHRVREGLGVMAMKRYFIPSKVQETEPHYQILFIVIPRIYFFWGGGWCLCSQYIQVPPIGQHFRQSYTFDYNI